MLYRVSITIASAVLALGIASAAQAGSSGIPSVTDRGAESGLRLGPPSFDDADTKHPTASAGTTDQAEAGKPAEQEQSE